jgi:ABC-type molybdenum transport system ATPase subunit/photorepair protein PhrA
MIFADHGVNFPVANADLFLDNLGSFINTNTIFNLSAGIFQSVLLFALLMAMPQMLILSTTLSFIDPNMLINTLMTNFNGFLFYVAHQNHPTFAHIKLPLMNVQVHERSLFLLSNINLL